MSRRALHATHIQTLTIDYEVCSPVRWGEMPTPNHTLVLLKLTYFVCCVTVVLVNYMMKYVHVEYQKQMEENTLGKVKDSLTNFAVNQSLIYV